MLSANVKPEPLTVKYSKISMKKCKNCSSKFNPKFFNQKYCLKDECIEVFTKETILNQQKKKDEAWKKRKDKLKESIKTHKDYLKDLQTVFNKYIRLRDKDKPCISCGKELKGKYDAGHYFSVGSSPSIRFNEDNVHGQCVYCNQHLHGNIHGYTEKLPDRIGIDSFNNLKFLRSQTNKYTINELIELKEIYKQKIKDLDTKF